MNRPMDEGGYSLNRAEASEIEDLSREDLTELVGIFMGKTMVHYGMWFARAVHHYNLETALEAESKVLQTYGPTALRRLAPHFGIEMQGDVPKALLGKTRNELVELLRDISRTWLAGDGLWFQELEAHFGMNEAKAVNDFCWSIFGRMEAFKIRNFLGPAAGGGLPALKKALEFRLYSAINDHEAYWEDDNTLVWKMLQCRVQNIRRGKGMDDYPCKSAGITEYSRFAQGVDPMIKTECILCPPDNVPEGQACSWRFTMKG